MLALLNLAWKSSLDFHIPQSWSAKLPRTGRLFGAPMAEPMINRN
jgi:hypothetical protein